MVGRGSVISNQWSVVSGQWSVVSRVAGGVRGEWVGGEVERVICGGLPWGVCFLVFWGVRVNLTYS
jgi:hypothetical protein